MKKIVIVTNKMVMGGVEKALIEMLKNMPKDDLEVTLLVKELGGELESQLPEWIKIRGIFDNEISIKEKIFKSILKGRLISAFRQSILLLGAYFSKNSFEYHNNVSKALSVCDEKYDLAVCYHVHFSFPLIYVINNVIAKKKVAWIHSDSNQHKNLVKLYDRYYTKYDHIFCVSLNALEKFIEMFPKYSNKVSIFNNCIYDKEIQELSNNGEGFMDNYNGIRILTVGRLCNEKGYDLIIKVLKRLLNHGYNLRWYCIGEGEERKNIEKEIKENNLNDRMVLLGSISNPYPYMKKCSLYVQPSRYEGYCITLAEARSLHKPIVTTNFAGAHEQIKDGYNGLIVNINETEIFNAIKRILDNEELRVKLIENLNRESIDTREEVNKLFAFINS
jgi:glycosyltransferase involved in cell wall biosynthesis